VGYFWEGIPPYLIPIAARALGSHTIAVETGTYQGDSALKFAEAFGECRTIERSENLARAAQDRFKDDSRIQVLIGSSRDLLTTALPPKSQPCFVWLDAHGVYDHMGSDQEENPLLAEVEELAHLRDPSNTLIAIDDARGLGTQPGWPSTGEVSKRLLAQGFDVVLLDDVLLAFGPDLEIDVYEIYKASRQVQIPMVFHLWPGLVRMFRRQERLNVLVSRLKR